MTAPRLVLSLLFCFLSLGFLIGCGKTDGTVVAKVGDEQITVREFRDFLDRNPLGYRSAEEEFEGKRMLLDSLISQTLIIQAGYAKHIDQSPEVARIIQASRNRFLLDALYYSHVDSKISVSESELRKIYDDLGFQLRAFHILLRNPDTASMVFEKLKAGENFEQMAYQYSIDERARRNRGDMGYFVRGTGPEEFEKVVFDLEVGEITPPFKTSYGYHIVKLVDRKPDPSRDPYARVRSSLEQQVRMARRQELTEQYFDSIAAKYPVTVDTAVTNYLIQKRIRLYPPVVVERLPKWDFDDEQLDRDEKELVLATWDGGQITLIDYLTSVRRFLPSEDRPVFDDRDSLAVVIYQLKRLDIMAHEAEVEMVDKTEYFNYKMKLFERYTVAEIMRNDSIASPQPPGEEELRDYYDQRREEYLVPAQVHLFEVLVSDQMLAQKLVREIKSLDQFQTMAYQHTERSAIRAKRGDLGYVDSIRFPIQFHAARQIPIGTVGGPIPDRGKFSILWPANWLPERYEDFLNVKESIADRLTTENRNAGVRKWLEQRREETDIEVYDDVIWSLIDKEIYGPADSSTSKS